MLFPAPLPEACRGDGKPEAEGDDACGAAFTHQQHHHHNNNKERTRVHQRDGFEAHPSSAKTTTNTTRPGRALVLRRADCIWRGRSAFGPSSREAIAILGFDDAPCGSHGGGDAVVDGAGFVRRLLRFALGDLQGQDVAALGEVERGGWP